MPTYICHGFRWPRPLIRIHIILQNLDDAAAEWLLAPLTTETMLQNFRTIYPEIMPSLPHLRFLEQYDPMDESVESKSQPFAYVCDVVQEVKLGLEIDEVRGRGVGNDAWTAMMDLRDKLAPGEKVSWFVVVCGDTERWAPAEGPVTVNGHGSSLKVNGHSSGHGGSNSAASGASRGSWERGEASENSRPSTSRSLKKLFSGGKTLRKTKSMKSLNTTNSGPSSPEYAPPPLPHSPHLPLPNAAVMPAQPPPLPPKNGPNITHAYSRLPPELRNPKPPPLPQKMPGNAF